MFLVGADNSILYTSLPVLRDELDTTPLQGLWIINAYPLVLSGLMLGTGTLGDKIGHRFMFLLGVALFGGASLLAAFSPSAWLLIGARAVLGAAAATMLPASLALIRITFTDPRERNTAIGLWGSVAIVGAASGPILGGLLLEHFWWGSVFLINVPVALLLVVGIVAAAPPNQPHPSRHWDFFSSLLAMLCLVPSVILIKEATTTSPSTAIIAVCAVLAVASGWAFGARQGRLSSPLLTLDIFRNPMFTGGALAAGIMSFCMAGVELMTTQQFQIAAGHTPLEASLLLIWMAFPAIPISILAGATVHRAGFLTMVTGGFAILAVGIVTLIVAFHGSADVTWGFRTGLVLAGVGAGMVMGVASNAIVGSAAPYRAGMASSVEGVSYEFGTLLAVAVLGSLMPAFYARLAPAEVAGDVNHGVNHPLLGEAARSAYDGAYLRVLAVAAAVAIVTVFLTGWCFRHNPKEATHHES